MKGIILAGGNGTRLNPLTKIVNKHLIQVYNKPMIYFPLQTLIKAGIDDILIVTSAHHIKAFEALLGNGGELGVKIQFEVQKGGALGISDAIRTARGFARGGDIAVILGDNIFEEDFSNEIASFKGGARIFIYEVHDPERFGVAELEGEKVISLEEKPLHPKSKWAATGFYLYDSKVFETIDTLEFSERGELEVTSLNEAYLNRGELTASKVEGFWIDAGTFESLFKASSKVRDLHLQEMEREHKSDVFKSMKTEPSQVRISEQSNSELKNV